MIAFHFLNYLSTMVINLLGGHLPLHLNFVVTNMPRSHFPYSLFMCEFNFFPCKCPFFPQ